MKIAVIGATGKAGNLIVKKAVKRGHEVTAIVRDQSKMKEPNVRIWEKDLFKLTYDDVKDQEVIIDAFGTWAPDTLIQHQTSLKYLTDILTGKPNRLLVVGGAGSLYVNPEHTTYLTDTPDFPDSFKPLATNMGKALEELRKCENVKWTYLSPSANFMADGERTGKYLLGGEELLENSKGESQISYADYAIAMIDEVENPKHIEKRFTIAEE